MLYEAVIHVRVRGRVDEMQTGINHNVVVVAGREQVLRIVTSSYSTPSERTYLMYTNFSS